MQNPVQGENYVFEDAAADISVNKIQVTGGCPSGAQNRYRHNLSLRERRGPQDHPSLI